MPPGGHNNFLGSNNIKNEISTIKILRFQIFSKIQQLLKNHYLRGDFLTYLGAKMPPGGELEFSRHIHYDFLKGNHKGIFHTKNQKNLQRCLEDIGSKVHFQPKRGFLGTKTPLGGAARGSQQLFGVKITSKMKSAPSNYSECKFSAKSNNF